MTLPRMDGHGNLHRAAGPGGGQFSAKAAAAPSAPLPGAAERLRAQVRISWRHLLNPANYDDPIDNPSESRRLRDGLSWFRRGTGRTTAARTTEVKSFITNVSIPTYTGSDAPVAIIVNGSASGTDVAREYRAVDGQLFRQVWGFEDPSTGKVTPISPTNASWAPAEPGRTYELRPVPADEAWLRQEAERHPVAEASSESHAAQIAQDRVSDYAAIDGHVWLSANAPVYRAPVVSDAPFSEPLAVSVEAAPDTHDAAADIGYFHADDYDGALQALNSTAKELHLPVSPDIQDEPPIQWVRSLGVVGDEPAWRAGVPLSIESSETLTEQTFRDRLAAFREQIVTIPGAVTGDVGSFLVVGDWRLDFAALTRQQQDEYRRYIVYGVEHGLI